jgi:nucleoside-diphosphate-sugar epimerase
MKSLFVTGGCGYLGRNIIETVSSKYDQIVIFERKGCDESWVKDKKIKVVYGDITAPETLTGKIPVGSVVIHLAALGPGRRMKIPIFEKVNIDGTKNVFDEAKKANAKKFFFMSTASVTGVKKDGCHLEEDAYNPLSTYAFTKSESEKLIKKNQQEGMTSIIFRAPPIYGPNPHKDSGTYNLIKLMQKPFCPVFGDGNAILPLCNMKNLIDGIALALSLDNNKVNTFFIRDEKQVTMNETLAILKELTGSTTRIIHLPKGLLYLACLLGEGYKHLTKTNVGVSFEVYHYLTTNALLLNIDKIKKIGYASKHTPRDGFKEAISSLNKTGMIQ